MDWKIGIICAGDSELEPFLAHIKNCSITEKAMLKFYEGQINNISIVTLFCGVCKVNAAIATQILVDHFNVNAVINAGTAGGMDETVQLLDTIVATQCTYHDVHEEILTEFHPWMSSVYFETNKDLLAIAKTVASKYPSESTVHFGTMVTGEQFIQDDCRANINEKFAPLSVDMETASIAHVCYANKIPFIAIRAITDTATHSGQENFVINCDKASAISKEFVLNFLTELN